jgi:hypothetical protein
LNVSLAENDDISQAFKIDFWDTSDQFIVGGFPYTGEVRATNHDGSARANEPLAICVRLFRDVEPVRNSFQSIWGMTEGRQNY